MCGLIFHYLDVGIGIGDCFLERGAEDVRADLIKLAEWKALESSAKVRCLPYTIKIDKRTSHLS